MQVAPHSSLVFSIFSLFSFSPVFSSFLLAVFVSLASVSGSAASFSSVGSEAKPRPSSMCDF